MPDTDEASRHDRPSVAPSHPLVVGIGASAGGLAALKELLGRVPADSGLAYVVVIHLSPEHESHVAELLQPHVGIPIAQVTGTVRLERNHVYVIPPNANLEAVDTHLRLTGLEERAGERAPIDHFFRTLSGTHDGRAAGVVLTGTGSDGALGIRAIKEKGGLTVVQDPGEAEYGGMPRRALASGAVDLVLPLAEIPGAVLRWAHTEPRIAALEDAGESDGEGRTVLRRIFTRLQARTGRDFSRYKRSTTVRRLRHRMQIHQLEELPDYLSLLEERGEEVRSLADELLITVTRFFRDSEVFETLEQEVIPALFDRKGPDDGIRVWCAGCATGEEAYSTAMLLLDEAGRRDVTPRLQIFASDLHEPSLERARAGLYPGAIEADVSSDRLRRFFRKEDGGFRVRDEVRDLVVFSSHDLLRDPPFSHLDLVLCRNLLIYLQRDTQEEVLKVLHYALEPDGILVLGTAETAGGSELFQASGRNRHVHRRLSVPPREPHLPVFSLGRRPPRDGDGAEKRRVRASAGVLHQRLLEELAPPSLLVDARGAIVHLSERAGRYLVHKGGEPTLDVTKLVREELGVELRAALEGARGLGEPMRTRPVEIRFDGESRSVVMDVRPAPDPTEELVLVIFDERPHPADETVASGPEGSQGRTGEEGPGHPERRVRELEEELDRTRQRLRDAVERYETTREEMEASNEELQSTNEELRSTMEELETSQEELQSTNEELQTTNQQNRHKVEELAQLTADLQNLLKATDIATLFLDRQLRIMRFTPEITALFNVQQGDRGRCISDFTHRLGYDELTSDAERVLDRLTPVEREVKDQEGRWYLTRVLPYRSPDDRIEGVVITFVDITSRKESEENLREAKTFAERIVETIQEPLLILTGDLHVRSTNPAFYEEFRVDSEETIGRRIYDLGDGQWDIPELRALLEDVLRRNQVFQDFEVQHEFDEIGRRTMLLDGRRLEDVDLILLGIRDVTEQRVLEHGMRQKHKMEAVGRLAGGVAHDFNNLLTVVEGRASLLLAEAPDDSDMRQDLEGIRDAGRRAAALTQQLLAFSREQILKTQDVALGRAVLDLEPILRRLIPARIELRVQVDEDLDPVVRVDPSQLQQIVLNLAINAAEAIGDSGAVTLRVDSVDLLPEEVREIPWEIAPGPFARLVVQDDGEGMSPKVIERIFDPFFTTREDRTGTGLGLATVYGIVKQSGGHILVESTRGRGTAFRVLLPRCFAPAAAQGAEPPRTVPSIHGDVLVLLVEDDGAVRTTLRRVLERAGYASVEAANGREALALLEGLDQEVDVVLSDVVMPDMGGIELAEHLAENRPGLPVILMSGHADVEQRTGLADVAAGFLLKPFTTEALLGCLAEAAGTRSRKDSAE